MRWKTCSLLLLCFAAPVSGLQAQQTVASATSIIIQPQTGEDFAAPCHYELALPAAGHKVEGIFLIFDRGRDLHDLYTDDDVVQFAARHNLALMLHGHCPGTRPSDREDMNMRPEEGLGPALWRALQQGATQTGHPEVATAKLIILGFSGTGPLSARLIASEPGRFLAGILSAPGHFSPDGIDNVTMTPKAYGIPELILAGSSDPVSGTALPFSYFRKYRALKAPWVFAIANGTPHCCTVNAKYLILIWLEGVLSTPMPVETITDAGFFTFFRHRKGGTTDSFGMKTFGMSHPHTLPASALPSSERTEGGWVPTKEAAEAWLNFVRRPSSPELPAR